jgi:WD40 repeat protein
VQWVEGEGGACAAEVLRSYDTGSAMVTAASLSADSSLLAALTDKGVDLYAWGSGVAPELVQLGRVDNAAGEGACVAFGPRSLLAVGADDGAVRLYDVGSPGASRLVTSLETDSSVAQTLAWSPTGATLAVCFRSGATRLFSVADAEAGRPVSYITLPSQGLAYVGTAVANASRSRRNATAGALQSKGVAWEGDERGLVVLESTMAGGAALSRWTSSAAADAPAGKARGVAGMAGGSSAVATGSERVWSAALVRKASRSPLTCLRGYKDGPAQRLLVGTSDGGTQSWSGVHLSQQWERPALHAMGISALAILEGGVGVSGSPDWQVAAFPLTQPVRRRSARWLFLMLVLLVLLLTSAWMALADHAARALQAKSEEL